MTELDLIREFDEVMKEHRLTKKVLLGTRRDPALLFGNYHETSFSYNEGAYKFQMKKNKTLIVSMDSPLNSEEIKGSLHYDFLSLELYSDDKDGKDFFTLHIYKDKTNELFKKYNESLKVLPKELQVSFETYVSNTPLTPIIIEVERKEKEIILYRKGIKTNY